MKIGLSTCGGKLENAEKFFYECAESGVTAVEIFENRKITVI